MEVGGEGFDVVDGAGGGPLGSAGRLRPGDAHDRRLAAPVNRFFISRPSKNKRSPAASGLLDADTNLKYAVKYLRGAWLVSGGNAKRADLLYQTGYYYDAKRKGLLEATGLGVDRRRLQPGA